MADRFQLTVKVKDRKDMFAPDGLIARRLALFTAAEYRARLEGARTATQTTRNSFKYKREVIGRRAGRSSTGGRMRNHLTWKATQKGFVRFDINEATSQAEHWIIQEIGTGSRATVREAAKANPRGRPRDGAQYIRTVRSQKGRRIRGGLVFASNGTYSAPGAAYGQQLHLASKVSGVPYRPAAIRISREIEGQHFVKKGGTQGFRQYDRDVRAAARQHLRKRKP